MNLVKHYTQAVADGRIYDDIGQRSATEYLQALKSELSSNPEQQSLITRLLGRRREQPRGLYLWGGVGRGKTWLMDLFYMSLPFDDKLRLHFRHFMQQIHEELDNLQGQRDPLKYVARHFARRARVLCLDELYVEDITDAMILYRLLDALLAQGMTLVFTSNLTPDELYKNGLQRERFLPAIAFIKEHANVVHLDGQTDHRLNKLKSTSTWYTPVNTATERAIEKCFDALAPGKPLMDQTLEINHRQICALRCVDDIAWFQFQQLCIGPRSSADYIELARRYHTVLISGIPIMGEAQEEWAHRFINLVDEFYDRRVKLIISAEAGPQYLYQGKRMSFEFQRTISRLLEMRSHDYLGEAHKP